MSSVQKVAHIASFPVLTAHTRAMDIPYIVCCDKTAKGELAFARTAPVEGTSESAFCSFSLIS